MPKTGINIYKRKDGRWEARIICAYKADGKPEYKSLYARTYAEAKQRQAAAQAGLIAPTIKTEDRVDATFEQAAMNWLAAVRVKVKESTFTKYERLLRTQILPRLGMYRLSRMTQSQLERCIGELVMNGRLDGGGGLSPKTTQDILMIVKSILTYVRPTAAIDFRAIAVKKDFREMRVLSKPEQAVLAQSLRENVGAAALGVLLSLYTGIRLGELCALRWEHVNLLEKTLSVHATLQRIPDLSGDSAKTHVTITPPKSKCSLRDIPLPDFLVVLLETVAAHPKAYLLTGDRLRFMEPRTVQYHFKKYIADCGIADANFHCLRHTFATRCIELGFDAKSLSEILGHSNVNITLNRYVHSSFDLKRENMAKLSALEP